MSSNQALIGPVGLRRVTAFFAVARIASAFRREASPLERSKLRHFHKIDAAFPPRLPRGPDPSTPGDSRGAITSGAVAPLQSRAPGVGSAAARSWVFNLW